MAVDECNAVPLTMLASTWQVSFSLPEGAPLRVELGGTPNRERSVPRLTREEAAELTRKFDPAKAITIRPSNGSHAWPCDL